MSDLKFSKEHTWAKIEDNLAIIGVSDFAQEELGEVVFIELPKEGDKLTKGKSFGVIESVKTVSDIQAPLSGKIIEVNEELDDEPEIVNEDPCEKGWIVKIEMADTLEIETLLSQEDYNTFTEESKK